MKPIGNPLNRATTRKARGFSLVITLMMMVLLTIIALGLLSLSTITLRSADANSAMARAQANARLALMMAIGDLQKNTGPDQRVTANASILETGSSTSANRQWMGVWKTTIPGTGSSTTEYPLIGKKSDSAPASEPYPYPFVYSDLRNTSQTNWKTTQQLGWMVSNPTPLTTLNPNTTLTAGLSAVEVVSTGTLGTAATAQSKVIVPLVPVNGSTSTTSSQSGAYGWWVSDNNQKASLNLANRSVNNAGLAVAQKDDPGAVASIYSGYYQNGDSAFYEKLDKSRTYRSLELSGADKTQLKLNFHDFTTDASGLFTDTLNGGLRKDLTQVLLSGTGTTVSFAPPNVDWPRTFSSASPIIPGRKHAMIGPSFDMLRNWAQLKNLSGLASGKVAARVNSVSNGTVAMRPRPVVDWPHGRPDGYTWKWETWAQQAPRLHPVMTDSRWHYYFSYDSTKTVPSLRTHLIPRVCLWNPYNVTLTVPDLVAVMPNPYWRYGNNFEFRLDTSTRNAVRAMPKYATAIAPGGDMFNWNGSIEMYGSANGGTGLFPNVKYLCFKVEAAEIPPGECLVYSPKITTGSGNVVTAGGIKIAKYDTANISNNVLSAASPQGKDHYYSEYEHMNIRLNSSVSGGNKDINPKTQAQYANFLKDIMDNGGFPSYTSWAAFYDGFAFSLKAAQGSMANDDVTITNSAAFPTLQLINNSNGGAATYDFWHWGSWWGDSSTASSGQFGRLSRFEDTPSKQPPTTHQVGTKLMWLDESANEGNAPPLRSALWGSPQLTVFNQAPIANWNVRPTYVGRSPNAFCSKEWYVNSLGSWILQFVPYGPGAAQDQPTVSSNGLFGKPPMGASTQFAAARSMPLFDLPNPTFGVLSIGALRNVQLSPFSWHPTYVVGASLADQSAPTDLTGNKILADSFSAGTTKTRWDLLIGGDSPFTLGYGPRTWGVNSEGILQQGTQAPPVAVEGQTVSADDEIFAYDIAYETNANLWDSFYVSSIPFTSAGAISWKFATLNQPLLNTRYVANNLVQDNPKTLEASVNAFNGATFAFWNSAYFIKNQGAFNVNSTSVDAWTAFLSGMRGLNRSMKSGNAGGSTLTVFARLFQPNSKTSSGGGASPTSADAWAGARELSDPDIKKLATEIVKEVKARGPFISLGDFINRKLAASDTPASRMGTLESAILAAGLNSSFTTTAAYKTTTLNTNDNNKSEWKVNYARQPESKAWGATGYLTQGDLLDSLGSSIAARGDTFTIRAYGESRQGNKVVARAMLEATVTRSPEFVSPLNVRSTSRTGDANRAIDPVTKVNRANGAYEPGVISTLNAKFGRRYEIVSVRWLNKDEI